MSTSKKTSQFTKITSLADANEIPVVANGANATISYSNFKTGLGVTGTLEADGALLNSPVLFEPVASEYHIRGLEDGPGVMFSITPDNGIKATWNVTQDTTGVTITDGLTDSVPVLSSMVAGAGMSIVKSGNTVRFSATGEITASNRVVINQESDFPTQTASTITLESGFVYEIASNISTAKFFTVQDGAALTCNNFFGPTLTYTGTGSMFVGVDAEFVIYDARINHPNAQGFDFTDTAGGQKIFWMRDTRIQTGTKVGTFNNMQSALFWGSSCIDVDQGVSISGANCLIVSADKFYIGSTNASFVGVDFGTSVVQNIELIDLITVGPSGSKGLKGAASSANVAANTIASVTACNFAGVTTPLDGISEKDIRWSFKQNSGVPDSQSDALVSMVGNVTPTVISTINTPVKVAGTFVTEDVSRFTHDGTGRLTYTSEVSERLPIDVSVSCLMASSTDKQIAILIAVNGSVITQTRKTETASSTKAANISTVWQRQFSTGDYLEIFVENKSDTIDIICSQAVIRIN